MRVRAEMEPRRASRAAAVLVDLFLWPGAGHLAVGRQVIGAAWIAATWAMVGLSLVWPPLIAITLLCRMGAAIDAGVGPARAERATSKAVAVVVALAMIGVAVLPVRLWVMEAFKIPSGGMAPTLVAGDHVLVDKLSYRLGSPGRGDVAAFRSPCAPHESYIKRVVGLPGDTVEVRCDVLYVNGRAVPAVLEERDQTWWDRVAEDHFVEQHASRYRETLGGTTYSIYSPVARPARDHERSGHPEAAAETLAGGRDFPAAEAPLPTCATALDRMPGAGPGDAPLGRIEGGAPPATGCAPFRHYLVPAGTVFVLGDNRDNSSDSRAFGAVPEDHLIGRVSGIWYSSRPSTAGGIQWDRLGRVH